MIIKIMNQVKTDKIASKSKTANIDLARIDTNTNAHTILMAHPKAK